MYGFEDTIIVSETVQFFYSLETTFSVLWFRSCRRCICL